MSVVQGRSTRRLQASKFNRLCVWRAALLILEQCDTAKALSIAILIRESNHCEKDKRKCQELRRAALTVSHHPSEYCERLDLPLLERKLELADRFRRTHLAVSFLSKISDDLGVDRKSVSLQKFLSAEEENGVTNRRLLRTRYSSVQSTEEARWFDLIDLARKEVRSILGPLDLERVFALCNFGPGATRQARNGPTLPAKISTAVVTSSHAWRLLSSLVGSSPIWFEAVTSVKPDGPCSLIGVIKDDVDELMFVPKSWKTDRSICVSHTFSVFAQKGFGKLIRHKLRSRAGIDLDDQSRNQALAMRGSLDGSLTTIDLASASDTVSIGIVRSLLPDDWFAALSSLRSVFTRLPNGEEILNQKFSAMGNGYTFELESLVFYSLTKVFFENLGFTKEDLDRDVSIYGDDIICPNGHNEQFFAFLRFCGFQINQNKSFDSGPFRESCGKDYIYGHDVRPFFIKERIGFLEDFFKLYNQIRAWHGRGRSCGHDNLLNRVLSCVYHSVHERFRFRIPSSFPGDAGFVSEFPPDQHSFPRKGKGCWDGWFFRYLSSPVSTRQHDDVSAMAAKLHSLMKRPALSDRDIALEQSLGPIEESPAEGNLFPRRSGLSRRQSRIGYTYDWA